MKYLVTSATGDLAGKAVQFLSELVPVENIAVTVRSKEKAGFLEKMGVDIRIADYFDKDSLVNAFAGIDRVLFVSSGNLDNRQKQHQNVIEALQEAKVPFVAYTSAPKAPESHALVAPDHQFTEKLLEKSGLNYVLLRNNWYLENETASILNAKQGRPILYSSGEGKAGWALKSDYAEAAARILAEKGPQKKIYELGGTPISYQQLAELINDTIEKPVPVHSLNDEQYSEELAKSGVPESGIAFVVGIQKDIRNGELDVSSDDLADVLDRKPTSLAEGIKTL